MEFTKETDNALKAYLNTKEQTKYLGSKEFGLSIMGIGPKPQITEELRSKSLETKLLPEADNLKTRSFSENDNLTNVIPKTKSYTLQTKEKQPKNPEYQLNKINPYGELVPVEQTAPINDDLKTRAFLENDTKTRKPAEDDVYILVLQPKALEQMNLSKAFTFAKENELPIHTLKPMREMNNSELRQARNYMLDKRKA
jgi:hypothetical protein